MVVIGLRRLSSLCSVVWPKSGHHRVGRLRIDVPRAELRSDTGLSVNGRLADNRWSRPSRSPPGSERGMPWDKAAKTNRVLWTGERRLQAAGGTDRKCEDLSWACWSIPRPVMAIGPGQVGYRQGLVSKVDARQA
jgi:hypothetical protein